MGPFFKKTFTFLLVFIFAPIGKYITLVAQVFGIIFYHPPSLWLIRDHMYNMGVLSLPVVAGTGFSTGLVLAAQSFFQLADKGLAGATGVMVAKSMTVEIGPILTAFMITGRVGAAMCAELGTMTVTEQIAAIRSMAVNPIRYLIAPRFIAMCLMIPFLMVFSGFMGVLGGYLISVYHFNMSPNTYIDPISVYMEGFDIFMGMVKAFVFGIIIVSISCYKGLSTKGGAAGVGSSTTTSVVICYSVILVVNFLLTLLLNNLYPVITRWINWIASLM